MEAETALDDYQRAARRRPQRGQPDHRGGTPAGRAGAPGAHRRGRDRDRRAARPCRGGHPARHRAGHGRPPEPGRRAVDRAGREGRRAQPRPRRPRSRSSRATSTRSGATSRAVDPAVEAYAKALLEVSRVEGHLADVEDELFRFARTFEGSDELRIALTDPALPRGAADRGGRGAARREGAPDQRRARVVHRRGRPGRRAAGDRRPVRRAGGGRARARGGRGAQRDRARRPSRPTGCARR